MDLLSDLFRLSKAYGKATGLAEASVSTRVLDGGGRLSQIRDGRDIGVRRLRKAVAWFSANWPEGISWPDGIERPEIPGATDATLRHAADRGAEA